MSFSVRKRGRFWYFRATVPMRQTDGKISKIRVEDPTGEITRARAVRAGQDLWDDYWQQAYRPQAKASPTFTDAALTYVKSKNPSKRDRGFAAKLVAHFGETPVSDIDQAAIAAASQTIYPGAKPATLVRAVYAPVTTILRLSGVRPDFKRPTVGRESKQIPADDWFDRILPHASPRLAALLIFLTLTGRRITEALEAIDNGDGTCTVARTKTGQPVVLAIPDYVRTLLGMPPKLGRKLFTYGDRHNVYRDLRKSCKRAVVPYYGTHALGRHAFATRLLREGKSLKFVADAGGWASIKMPAQHYAHLEHSEVQDEVKAVGDSWGREREKARKANKNNKG
jgi:integrase